MNIELVGLTDPWFRKSLLACWRSSVVSASMASLASRAVVSHRHVDVGYGVCASSCTPVISVFSDELRRALL